MMTPPAAEPAPAEYLVSPMTPTPAPTGAPATLLTRLLDYILEQSREVVPRGCDLEKATHRVIRRAAISGLPGVLLQAVAGDYRD